MSNGDLIYLLKYRYSEMFKEKMPSVLVVIDDYDELDKSSKIILDDFVMSTCYLFRGCGFSFIFTTKKFYALSSSINSILTHQIVFKPKENFKLRRLLNGAYPKINYGNIFYFTSDYEDTKVVDMSEILDISNKDNIDTNKNSGAKTNKKRLILVSLWVNNLSAYLRSGMMTKIIIKIAI